MKPRIRCHSCPAVQQSSAGLTEIHWRTLTYQVANRQPLIYDYTTETHFLHFRRQCVPSGRNLGHRSLHISSTYANTHTYQDTQADGADSNAHFC